MGRGLLSAAAIGIVGFAIVGDKTDGIPQRFTGQIGEILAVENTFSTNYKRCLNVRKNVLKLT